MEKIHTLRDILKKKTRFEGCVLHSSDLGQPPKISEVFLEGDSLRICMPSIRTDFSLRVFSKIIAKCHAATTINLLESLGFTVNYQKSVLIPSTTIEFLGFLVDSKTLTLSLSKEKIKKAKTACQAILDNPLPSIQQLSPFGLSDLHHSSSLSCTNSFSVLSNRQKQGLEHLPRLLSNTQPQPTCKGRTDLVEGQFGSLELESPSFRATRPNYRNTCLPQRVGSLVHGANDRGKMVSPGTIPSYKLSTTVSKSICPQSIYKGQGSNAGSTVNGQHISSPLHQQNGRDQVSNSSLTRQKSLGMVSRTSNCARSAAYPGNLKHRTDRESRIFVDNNDWKLAPQVFDNLNHVRGPLDVDLFATRLSKQLPRFVSWRPDPEAKSLNAWAQDCSKYRGYAFPPFSLVGRCLKQVLTQSVPTLVLIAPVWRTQSWYPLLLELGIAPPRLLPQVSGQLTRQQEVHPLSNLQLAVWLVSASHTRQQAFRDQLETCSSQHGERVLQTLIPQLGENGPAGVVNG